MGKVGDRQIVLYHGALEFRVNMGKIIAKSLVI